MNPEKTWQVLDPAAGSVPGELESALGDGDSLSACVVILVDSEIDRDWGAQASLAVAKRWAASGHRIILADACLDGPTLHEAVGVENGEGVSDMVLYGASAQRITSHVEGRLMLAPAGTPVSRVADVLEHVKWDMVIRGCREAGATLVFHVSTGTPGSEAMTKRAEGVLVLAPSWKDVGDLLGSEAGPLMAVLGPANGDQPYVESAGEEGDVAVVDVPPAHSAVADPPETPDAFGIVDLEGSQYDSEDSSEVALEGGEAPPSAPDEIEIEGPPAEESTAAVEEIDYGALDIGVPVTADSGPGAGVELGEPDPASGAPTELDAEASLAEVGVEDALADVGVGEPPAEVGVEEPLADVGVEEPLVDVGVEEPLVDVGVEEPLADVGVGDSPAEVGVQDPLADVGAEDSLAGVGVEALPTEEPKKAAKPKRVRRRQRGLSRLKWQKRRGAFLSQLRVAMVTVAIGGGGLYVAAMYGLVTVPGLTLPNMVRSYVPPPQALPGPTPETGVMSHVLQLDLDFEIETPLSIAEALRSQLPNLLFFVTPMALDGRLQFGLFAGPAYSAAEALALKEPISVAMSRENPDDWVVKAVPFAFYFGEYESAANAEGRVRALARASIPIPAYALQVTYPDGRTRVRVYGGAFWDEFQAEEMGRMIRDAGVGELVLTPRRGAVPE